MPDGYFAHAADDADLDRDRFAEAARALGAALTAPDPLAEIRRAHVLLGELIAWCEAGPESGVNRV